MRARAQLILVSLVAALVFGTCRRDAVADWTVMVYLNGDNTLSNNAMVDFKEMAHVGSSDRVNIVVQFDRQHGDSWEQTLRFFVTQGLPAEVRYAYSDLGEVDMASGKSVEDFVRSAMNGYPARHYVFVLWGHGEGYRFELASRSMINSLHSYEGRPKPSSLCSLESTFPPSKISFKGGTTDGTTTGINILYMKELAQGLKKALGEKKLDVVVFDECLMGMVENAYALREVASYMVASEEMIPPGGLCYSDWLSKLVSSPRMSPATLATTIVESYDRTYRRAFDCMTMSATDLAQARNLGGAISSLADQLSRALPHELTRIVAARKACNVYGRSVCVVDGDCFYHVDLVRFCEELMRRSADSGVRSAATTVVDAVRSSTILNVAGSATKELKGSNGLAIYFPPSGNAYCEDDTNECGYEPDNDFFPLDFVAKERWQNFLHDYFKKETGMEHQGCRSATLSDCPHTKS